MAATRYRHPSAAGETRLRADGICSTAWVRMSGRRIAWLGLLSLTLFSLLPSTARAGLSISITGTVAEGTLAGNSLNGQSFTLQGELVSGIDLATSEQTVGLFALSGANISFDSGLQFVFDSNEAYFVQSWQLGSGDLFQVGIVDAVILSGIDDQFGYSQSTNLGNYDPNTISAFSFSFDGTANGFAFDAAGSMGDGATFTNDGSTLNLTGLSITGASFRSVPEPSSCWGLVALTWVVGPGWRRRARKSAELTWSENQC